MLAIAAMGAASFFGPWLVQAAPEIRTWSGVQFAQRLGWLWGAGLVWPVIAALVVTRKTIRQMLGVRLALCIFFSVPLTTVIARIAIAPTKSPYVTLHYEWGWGMYLCAAVAAVGMITAWRFGGSRIDVTTTQDLRSHDETLH